MKKTIFASLSLCILLSFRPTPEKKVLLVLLDGIPADALESTETLNIDAIIENGAYAKAYVGGQVGGASESPTISAVGYNSMLTGTWANKHNVYGNSIKNPNYDYPSIFQAAKDSDSTMKLGIYSTWEDNRTKLLGEGLAATNHLKIDYAFDGYELDTIRFPHDAKNKYLNKIDDLVAQEAAKSIKKDAPDLSWVYLEYTDAIGHKFGDSPEMIQAIQLADKQVGQLWEAIQFREKEFDEDWLIIITTDHGRDVETGKGHGGQTERERTTWIVTNKANTNVVFNTGLSIVDIYPTVAHFLNLRLPSLDIDGRSFLF
ncbi:MAG: putative AlkP superfamily pyrophosphatase or phosphodiesterase [Arcticibacterium sp.]|jgi:predicted AlkP superfamily pyrophosphatase or phosphodiesterase